MGSHERQRSRSRSITPVLRSHRNHYAHPVRRKQAGLETVDCDRARKAPAAEPGPGQSTRDVSALTNCSPCELLEHYWGCVGRSLLAAYGRWSPTIDSANVRLDQLGSHTAGISSRPVHRLPADQNRSIRLRAQPLAASLSPSPTIRRERSGFSARHRRLASIYFSGSRA